MKVGDIVVYCDPGCAQVETVLVMELVPDTLPGGEIHGAVVMNELGTHWVACEYLVELNDEIKEILNEMSD